MDLSRFEQREVRMRGIGTHMANHARLSCALFTLASVVTLLAAITVLAAERPAGPVPRAPVVKGADGAPDLVVSDLLVVSREVRFKVRNVGGGTKPGGRVNYALTATYFDGSGRPTGSKSYAGVAALTSLARLGPGQETGEDRVTGQTVFIAEQMRLDLCINPDRAVAESTYDNNCLSKTSAEVLPDIAVTGGRLNLFKPKEEESTLEKIGDFIWDTITLSHEFDPSGISQDHVIVTIRNNGKVPVTNFEVAVGVWKTTGGTGKLWRTTFKDVLGPGESKRAGMYIDPDRSRWSDTTCCQVEAAVDPDGRIIEFDESNNKMILPTVRVRDHR